MFPPKSFAIRQRCQWYRYASPRIITYPRIVAIGRLIYQLDAFVAFLTKQQTSNQVQEVTVHTTSPTTIPLMYLLQRLCIPQSGSGVEVVLIIRLQRLITNLSTVLILAIFHSNSLCHT